MAAPPVPLQKGAGRSDQAGFGGGGGAGPLGLGDIPPEGLEMIVGWGYRRALVCGPGSISAAAGDGCGGPDSAWVGVGSARLSRRAVFPAGYSSSRPLIRGPSARDDNTYIKISYYP